MIFVVVRQGVSNLDSSVVVHELNLAINRDLYGCLCSLSSQQNAGSLLVFTNAYTKPDGILKNMVIDYRLFFSGSLFISLLCHLAPILKC